MNALSSKQTKFLLMSALVLLAVLVSVPALAARAPAVRLNATAKTLQIGSNGPASILQLVASRGTSKEAPAGVWASSDGKVARVNGSGRVTPLRKGKSVISFTLKGSSGARARCVVTVKEIEPTSVLFDKPRSVLRKGDRVLLKPTVKPANALNKKLVFRSSNSKVASVNSKGEVKALKAGTATITCRPASGQGKASMKIVVSKDFSGTRYRFFGIGNANYQGDSKLPGCKNDLAMMKSAFQNASFSGNAPSVTTRMNLTGKEMRQMLGAMSSGARASDVTIFYYTGHGMNGGRFSGALCGVDWDLVAVDEVQKALDKVPGTVIVMLDCCLSGRYIAGKSLSDGEDILFSEAYIKAFSNSIQEKALTDSAKRGKYKILTACGPNQSSYISNDRQDECSVFTDYLAQALGEELDKGKTAMKADKNTDQVVTLGELYGYVSKRVGAYVARNPAYRQTVMVWPSGDGTAVIARN